MLSDRDIQGLLVLGDLVVEPLSEDTVRENGLDLRLGRGYCRLRLTEKVLDTRAPGSPDDYYECGEADEIVIMPYEIVLLHTMEYVGLPEYLAGLVNLRSTYARLGLRVPPTVVDAGFKGQIVIEVVGSAFPVKLYAGDRFLHLVLVRLSSPALRRYSGEYLGQTGVRLPKIFGGGGRG